MMNLYASKPLIAPVFEPKRINTNTVYLESVEKETGVKQKLKVVTVLSNGKNEQLYVLSCGDTNYLTDKFMLGEGILNNLYSSKKLR